MPERDAHILIREMEITQPCLIVIRTECSLPSILSKRAIMSGVRFSATKCEMRLQNRSVSLPRSQSEIVDDINHFTYLENLFSPGVLVSNAISAQIRKARLAFHNLRYLYGGDVHLSTKRWVSSYNSSLCITLWLWNLVHERRRSQVIDQSLKHCSCLVERQSHR